MTDKPAACGYPTSPCPECDFCAWCGRLIEPPDTPWVQCEKMHYIPTCPSCSKSERECPYCESPLRRHDEA